MGTVHGYAFIYQLIDQYKDSKLRVLLAKDSQKGILDLCEEAFGNRLILMNSNDIVDAKELVFVKNNAHTLVEHSVMERVVPLFLKPKDRLCIACLKTTDTINITDDGILNQEQVKGLNIPTRFVQLRPEDFSEPEWISIVFNCEEMIVGWNSCFFKAIMYLVPGHKCKKIQCIIVGSNFKGQSDSYGKVAFEYTEKCNVSTIFHTYSATLKLQ